MRGGGLGGGKAARDILRQEGRKVTDNTRGSVAISERERFR